jgi:hypothetical protein
MKTILLLSLLLVIVLFGANDLIAQPPPMLPDVLDQAPIDGGLSLIALVGGAYAFKKLKVKK